MPIDMSAAKAPPRKSTPRATTPKPAVATPPPAETRTVNDVRREGLNGLASLAQAGLLIFGQRPDAAAVGMFFPPVAAELANLADENETVAKPIDFLIQIGPYGALVTALLPLCAQIAANHKMVDAATVAGLGVVAPEVLDAQMRAQMASQQASAMRQQQAAIAEARAQQAAYEQAIRDAGNEMASMQAEVVG